MRKTIIAAAAALTLAGGAVAAWTAEAQPAAPADGGPAAHLDGGPGAHMDGPMGGPPMMGMHGGMMHGGMMRERMMHRRWRLGALIVPAEDRHLSGADVQKIAEAFLLWNGNHAWKVTEVTENPDNSVGFAFATQSGDVIARYSMDRRTGHVERVG